MSIFGAFPGARVGRAAQTSVTVTGLRGL